MDKILESQHINNDSWKRFNEKLVYFCNDAGFVKALKNTKIIYETYYKQPAPIDNVESLLQTELKLQFWFYDCEVEKFVPKFKKLPFVTKILLLKYCEEKQIIKISVSPKDEALCLKKVDDAKKLIGHKIFDFSDRGYKWAYLPLRSFMTLIQYNCFDITKLVDQMIIEFFAKYLHHQEIKDKLLNNFTYDFYCDLFFSSRVYKDFSDKYNAGEIVKKIDSQSLNFIRQNTPETQEETTVEEDNIENKLLVG
jgi:hypothetical protein